MYATLGTLSVLSLATACLPRPLETGGAGSGGSELRMSMPEASQFSKEEKLVAKLSLFTVDVKKSPSATTEANCSEPAQIKGGMSGNNFSTAKAPITKGCAYDVVVNILDSNNVALFSGKSSVSAVDTNTENPKVSVTLSVTKEGQVAGFPADATAQTKPADGQTDVNIDVTVAGNNAGNGSNQANAVEPTVDVLKSMGLKGFFVAPVSAKLAILPAKTGSIFMTSSGWTVTISQSLPTLVFSAESDTQTKQLIAILSQNTGSQGNQFSKSIQLNNLKMESNNVIRAQSIKISE